MDISKLLKELTVEEKAALLSGTDFMYTNPVPRLSIPALSMADGPHGLRKQAGDAVTGMGRSLPATAFPTAAATACGWDRDNLKKMGEAMGDECLAQGVHINLGPAVNIKRDPRCGRNFEYFSEDPLVAGSLGAALAEGIQSKGVAVSVKHFAANNQEDFRSVGDSIVDERALREIYLRGFETIVKQAKPKTLMCAYNKINGEFCSENKWLLTDVLRGEWGFDGVVMTDWGATKNRVKGVKAGLDLEMPGDTAICRSEILAACGTDALPQDALDAAVRNVLNLVDACTKNRPEARDFDQNAHHELAGKIAEESAVLLKNDSLLPLSKNEKLLVVGELFEKMRYQGAGSSMINPTRITTPKNAFDGDGIDYLYKKGYLENTSKTDARLIDEAVAAVADYSKVLIFAGLTDYVESEGFDRADMKLPQNQTDLIEALIAAGKKIVLVLFGGSPVELPFAAKTDAVLNMYLPGQNGGSATKRLLFGEANPSGKLAETWANLTDIPFGTEYSKKQHEVYKEDIFVGYRYYGTNNVAVAFPFGHGKSYTTFEYSNLSVEKRGGEFFVSCDVTNTGSRDGAEVVQLYVKNNAGQVRKAKKELRAFAKVFVVAGQTVRAEMNFAESALCYYHTAEKAWVLENGEYGIEVGASSTDTRLTQKLEITEQPEVAPPPAPALSAPPEAPLLPLTVESRFGDFKKTFFGRIIRYAATGIPRKALKKAQKLPAGAERDNAEKSAYFLAKGFDNTCVRGMSMCAGKMLPMNVAEGLVEISNGHPVRGIKKINQKITVPSLPKDEGKAPPPVKNKGWKQFLLFLIFSVGVTVLQLILMPLFKAIFNATPLVDTNFQIVKMGSNYDGTPYYIFDYAAGKISAGGGGGLAYFLAVQITLLIAQVVNFFAQRNVTFKANNNALWSAMWYAIAYVVITVAAAALQGLYKAPLYNLLIDAWGKAGETTADVLSMLLNTTLSFLVFFPIFKLIFKQKPSEKKKGS